HPVPGYDHRLAKPADLYMARLKPHRPSWRCNWNVVDSPNLYLRQSPHPQGTRESITPANAGVRLFIRLERQTLRKLQKCSDVLITIRYYIRSLSVLEGFPALAKGLWRALEMIPLDMREYKNQLAIREPLLAYLARIGGEVRKGNSHPLFFWTASSKQPRPARTPAPAPRLGGDPRPPHLPAPPAPD